MSDRVPTRDGFGNELVELGKANKDVVVISGGAKGVTAAAALALAEKAKPTIILLGRSAAPMPEPEWLTNLDNDDLPDMLTVSTLHVSEGGDLYVAGVNSGFYQ